MWLFLLFQCFISWLAKENKPCTFRSLHPSPDLLGISGRCGITEENGMSQAALRVVGKEQNNDRKRALEAALSQIDRPSARAR